MIETVKHILYMDRFVTARRRGEEQRIQRGIALIAALVFGVMSVLNVRQGASGILTTTAVASALLLLIGCAVSSHGYGPVILRGIIYVIFLTVFTAYILTGWNEGFAALWLITAVYAVMLTIDLKAGFLIGAYYFIMLLAVFLGPLSSLMVYGYSETFRLRFPVFYGANYAFATYITFCVRRYQYELLLNQQELERLSILDLSTGLRNRNRFIRDGKAFTAGGLKRLLAIFIDVNGLHEINNRDGHDAGDRAIAAVAALCREHFPGRAVYRMGGDEFLILCEDAREEDVQQTICALTAAVEQAGYSISYGVEVQESPFDLDRLVKRADEKMIRSKRAHYQRSQGADEPPRS